MNRFLIAADLLTALALTSCENVVDLNVPAGPPLLVVDGAVTDQPGPYRVRLTQTAPYFDNAAPPPVTGAVLTLTDNVGGREVLREQSPGVYVTTGPLWGRVGNRYVLTIAAQGEQYRAETEIRRAPALDSLGQRYEAPDSFGKENFIVRYFGQEPAGVGDYYRFLIFQNGVLRNEPNQLNLLPDDQVDGTYFRGLELNGGRNEGKLIKRGDRIRVAVQTLPADYYFFLNEVATQINNEGLFASPPANVRTNVQNLNAGSAKKAVGYFAGYATRTDSLVIR